jgi:hypothetical protein
VTTSPNPAAPNRPIAVIGGTGPAGMGLALRWARAGETIIIGSRDPERAQQAAAAIQQKVGARHMSPAWRTVRPAPPPTFSC